MEPAQTSVIPGKTVAVVMATFNGALYLEAQLDSILNQSLKPVEIIVCDDCSTDSTPAILDQYSRDHPSVSYLVNEERLGVIANFKKAVSLAPATGYIALADQDDIWMPDKLWTLAERMNAIADARRPAMVYSDLMVIDKAGRPLNHSFWNELGHDGYTHCFETLLFGNFVTGCALMMDQPMRLHFAAMPADVLMHDAWLALIAFSFGSVAEITTPLVKYRRHDANLAFIKTYHKKNRWEKLVDHTRLLWGKNDYLADQFRLVGMFYERYAELLTKEQARMVADFLELSDSGYLKKKLSFRAAFKAHWLK